MKPYKVIPPEACYWSSDYLRFAVDFTAQPVEWFIPDEFEIVPMGWLLRKTMGATPAITLKKIYVNPMYPYLAGETLVHEYIHWLQRQRMGPLSYNSTYVWQNALSLVRKGANTRHIHNDHLMEREARRIARQVITQCYVPRQPLNIKTAVYQVEPSWGM